MKTQIVTWKEAIKKNGKSYTKEEFAHFVDEKSARRFMTELCRTANVSDIETKASHL